MDSASDVKRKRCLACDYEPDACWDCGKEPSRCRCEGGSICPTCRGFGTVIDEGE